MTLFTIESKTKIIASEYLQFKKIGVFKYLNI